MNPAKRQSIVTEDGELREVAPETAASMEPVYCTKCGTANPPDSNFCRNCGHSLVEQDAAMAGIPSRSPGFASKPKGKHQLDDLPQFAHPSHQEDHLQPNGVASALRELFTMIFVAGMAIPVFVSGQGLALVGIFVLIAWFLVEAVRRTGTKHRGGVGATLVDIITMVFITGMFIPASLSGPGFGSFVASSSILVAWFLIEAVRAYL